MIQADATPATSGDADMEDGSLVNYDDTSTVGTLGEAEDGTLTLEILGEKLKTLAAANKAKLDQVEQKKNDEVTCGFYYTLNTSLPNTEWTIQALPGKVLALHRLQTWHYTGPVLEVVDDVFNDKLDYECKGYEDVIRLNESLLKVGSKFCDLLADRSKPRAAVSTFVKNLEILSSAIEELLKLVVDTLDNISDSPKVKEAMEMISSGAELLKAELGSNATVNISYTNDTRTNDDDEDY